MAKQKPIRLSEERAKALLHQALRALQISTVAIAGWFMLFGFAREAVGDPHSPIPFGLSITLGVAYWGAGIFYLVWLWRLATGLGRSRIIWIGGTMFAMGFLYFLAWWISWANMRTRIRKSFQGESESLVESG